MVREAKPRAVLGITSRPGRPGYLGPASPGWETFVYERARTVQCQRVPSSGLRTEHRRPMDNNESHSLSPAWAAKCKARTAWRLLLPWQRCFVLAGAVHGEDRINTAGNDTRAAPGIPWQALPCVGPPQMRGRRDAWKLAAPSSSVPGRAGPSSRPRALGLSASLPRALEERAAHSGRSQRHAGRARGRSEALLFPQAHESAKLRLLGHPHGRPHSHPHSHPRGCRGLCQIQSPLGAAASAPACWWLRGTNASVCRTGDPCGGHGGREKLLRPIICWTHSYSLPLSKGGRREAWSQPGHQSHSM